MPLPMQADKLRPSYQNIVRSGFRPGTPDRRGRDRQGNAPRHVAQATGGQLPLERFGIERGGMGGDIDERAFQPLGFGMAKFERGEFLQMVVQEPGMIE